jgi:LPXTG-motif cell wall-anchored protein
LDAVLSAESSPVPSDAGSGAEIGESLDDDSGQRPEFSPLGGEEQGSGFTMIWLPILGGLLILAGLAGVIIQRRQQ